jgi:hypothetical protein
MSTKSLFKHFLLFSLFALLLLPQIRTSGSALAKRPTATPTPRPVTHTKKSAAKSVIKAVPSTCLSLALSTAFSDGTITVANPPGEAVNFAVVPVLYNNCGTTVTWGGYHNPTLEEMIQEQPQPVCNPFVWEGTMNLEGIPFCGIIRYYAAPLKMSGFNFNSEKSVLTGVSYGPSCDEVIELLEGLQVINGRDDVLRQYDGS